MSCWRERIPDSNYPYRKTFDGLLLWKLDIHRSVADQRVVDENGRQLRTHCPGLPVFKPRAHWNFMYIVIYFEQASKEVEFFLWDISLRERNQRQIDDRIEYRILDFWCIKSLWEIDAMRPRSENSPSCKHLNEFSGFADAFCGEIQRSTTNFCDIQI